MAMRTAAELLAAIERGGLLPGPGADPSAPGRTLADARAIVEPTTDARSAANRLVAAGLLTRWQAGQLLAGRESFRLGNYLLVDLLGHGRTGSVFLARHVMMNRPAALRVIADRLTRDRGPMERFLAEVRAVSALDHPSLVGPQGIDNEGDQFHLASEYVEGPNLEELIDRDGPLEWPAALGFVQQAADALAVAHAGGVVHGELGPSKLRVGTRGEIRVLGFGLSALRPGGDREASGDDASPLGPDVDVMALGGLLHYLLSGRPPTDAVARPPGVHPGESGPTASLAGLGRAVPAELDAVFRRTRAADPRDRYQDAGELADALKAIRRRPGPTAAPTAASGAIASGAASDGAEEPASPSASGFIGLRDGPRARTIMFAAAGLGLVLLGAGVTIGVLIVQMLGRPDERPRQAAADTADRDRMPITPQRNGPPGDVSTDPSQPDDDWGGWASRQDRAASGAQALPDETTAPNDRAFPDDATPAADAFPGEDFAFDPVDPARPPDATPRVRPQPDPASSASRQVETTAEAAESPDPPANDEPPTADTPAEPPPSDPLGDLASRIDMPSEGFPSGVQSLGQPHIPDGARLRMELASEAAGLRGARRFMLAEEPNAPSPRWLIQLGVPGAADATPRTDIARLGLAVSDGTLKIAWLPDARGRDVHALRNCALKVVCAGEHKWLRFGAPQIITPIPLDISRMTPRINVSIDRPIDPDTLRFQVMGLSGQEPPPLSFKPAGRDTVSSGEAIAARVGPDEGVGVELRLGFEVRGRVLRLSLAPFYTLPNLAQPRPLNPAELTAQNRQLLATQQQLAAMQEKAKGDTTIAGRLTVVNQHIEQMNQLRDLLVKLATDVAIDYRAYVVAGGHPVEVFTSKDPAATPSPPDDTADADESPDSNDDTDTS